MHIEPLSSLDEVFALLSKCALTFSDISITSPPLFFGIHFGDALVAVVGLELYPPFGLLRSLAVAPPFRGRGLARKLVAFAESFSAAQGVESLFLLTDTAEAFFLGLGYSPTNRNDVPPVILATSEFSELCPSSSTCLSKYVVKTDYEK